MADEKKVGNEPQSYGGQKEWTAGKTGEQVNGSQKKPAPATPFYDQAGNAESTSSSQGGMRSPVDQAEDRLAKDRTVRPSSEPKPADTQGGTGQRDSFFKSRDYSGS